MESAQDITVPILERQMRLWNALQHKDRPKTSGRHRFLTISREAGVPTEAVSATLAQTLHWRIYDKEIVDRIAGDCRVHEDLVAGLDERSSMVRYSILDTVLNAIKLPDSAPLDARRYHDALLRTLAAIAAHGAAIIVGRGANFVLRWTASGFHVRLTGSLEMRLLRYSETCGMDPDTARKQLLKIDEERRSFIRQHFQTDAEDPGAYDVVYNTDQLSPRQITDSILSLINPESAQAETVLPAHW